MPCNLLFQLYKGAVRTSKAEFTALMFLSTFSLYLLKANTISVFSGGIFGFYFMQSFLMYFAIWPCSCRLCSANPTEPNCRWRAHCLSSTVPVLCLRSVLKHRDCTAKALRGTMMPPRQVSVCPVSPSLSGPLCPALSKGRARSLPGCRVPEPLPGAEACAGPHPAGQSRSLWGERRGPGRPRADLGVLTVERR